MKNNNKGLTEIKGKKKNPHNKKMKKPMKIPISSTPGVINTTQYAVLPRDLILHDIPAR